VADVVLGDVPPGGKLPFSWPRAVGQIPVIYSHTISHQPGNQGRRYWDETSTPLFPFGHGLSYSRFEYRDLTVDRNQIHPGQTAIVSVTVTNAGQRSGGEVAQLYIHQRHGSASRPVRELKGFQRVTLAAGESRILRFAVGPDQLRYWNAATRDWVIDTTTVDVFVGGDSTAELTTSFTIATRPFQPTLLPEPRGQSVVPEEFRWRPGSRVGFELPGQADVPAEADPVRRVVGEHPGPSGTRCRRCPGR
jgi:beta-glucosidase